MILRIKKLYLKKLKGQSINNMEFYTSISRFYDRIFPYDNKQYDFINSFLNIKKDQSILEAGCGTGFLSIKLSENGYNVYSIDFDQEMINLAINNKKNNSIYPVFKKTDMRFINSEFKHDFFDLIFCFGNTLVHLTEKNDIFKFILDCKKLLKKKGFLLIQILNYDYILDKKVTALPLLENDQIKFERSYSNSDYGLINFNTSLTIKKENNIIKNSIKLYPIRKKELDEYLKEAGFKAIEYYSGFDKSSVKSESLSLIIKGE